MTILQIVFIIIAAFTLGAAFMVVTARNLVHAALWLIVALFGIAVVFALLNASFLAVAQVVIYIGAISILIIFTIMLTRRVAADSGPQINPNWLIAAVIGLVFFGGIVWTLSGWQGFSAQAPPIPAEVDPVRMLGAALVSPNGFVLAFELASVLLLAALIGAIIVAWERK